MRRTDRGELLQRLLTGAVCLCAAVVFVLVTARSGASEHLARTYTVTEISDFAVTEQSAEGYTGVRVTYSFLLPESASQERKDALAIYVVHQYARVYIGGSEVYAASEPSGYLLNRTPGCPWIFIPLRDAKAGAEVRIELAPVYRSVTGRAPYVLMSDRDGVRSFVLRQDAASLAASGVCVVAGLICWVLTLAVLRERPIRRRLLYLGGSSVTGGLWRFCDLQSATLLFTNPYSARILSAICLLSLLLMPLMLICFLSCLGVGRRFRLYRAARGVVGIECLTVLLVQFLGLADLRECLPAMHVAALTAIVFILADGLAALPDCLRRGEKVGAVTTAIILAVVAMSDVIRYYIDGSSRNLTAFPVAIAAYTVMMGVVSIYRFLEDQRAVSRERIELAELRNKLMLSQIQPHFIYNTLTSIYYLCEEDPALAQSVIGDFTEYLRRNFEALTATELVPLEDELRHTRAYLAIEQMRVGDRLRVTYDIRCAGVRLPVLTLQPLAENAVKHGLRTGGGTVNISIRAVRYNGYVELTVEDDGRGFDAALSDENGGVGLANIRERLRLMCGGELTIRSVPGRGTTATIRLPL